MMQIFHAMRDYTYFESWCSLLNHHDVAKETLTPGSRQNKPIVTKSQDEAIASNKSRRGKRNSSIKTSIQADVLNRRMTELTKYQQ